MLIHSLAVAAVIQTQKPVVPSLNFEGKKITVKFGDKVSQFSVDEDPMVDPPVPHKAFRKDEKWAVWDNRGLTIRNGKKVFSTKLGEIAVSPRAFSRETIVKNLDAFNKGTKKKEADSLSGYLKVDSKCYFVPRWSTNEGKTWLEALVMVDLQDENPKPVFLGKFKGFSTAFRPLDDKLLTFKGKIAMVTQEGDTWGLGTFEPETKAYDFSPLGSNLVSYYRGGYFLEETSYGTSIVGQIDLNSGLRKNLFETRSKMIALKDGANVAVVKEKGNTVVRNLKTGGQIIHGANAFVAPIDDYVLVWTKDKRTTAWLYEPNRWTQVVSAAN
jgi:hypothetical protein